MSENTDTPAIVFPERKGEEARNLYFSQFEDDGSRPPKATEVRSTELRYIKSFIENADIDPRTARSLADEWITRQSVRYAATARNFYSHIAKEEGRARNVFPEAGLTKQYSNQALNFSSHIARLQAQAEYLHNSWRSGVVFDVNDVATLQSKGSIADKSVYYEGMLSAYAPPDHLDLRLPQIDHNIYRETGVEDDYEWPEEYEERGESDLGGNKTIHSAFEGRFEKMAGIHEWYASSVVSIEQNLSQKYGDEIAHAYNAPDRNAFVRDINRAGFVLSDTRAKNDDMFKDFTPSVEASFSGRDGVNETAIEWAAYVVARDMARQNGVELKPITLNEVAQDHQTLVAVKKFRDHVKLEAERNGDGVSDYSDKNRSEFIGYHTQDAATKWAGLAIARDELIQEGKELPSISVENVSLNEGVETVIREELAENLRSAGIERDQEELTSEERTAEKPQGVSR